MKFLHVKKILLVIVLIWPPLSLAEDDFIDASADDIGVADMGMVSGLDLRHVQRAFDDSKASANVVMFNYVRTDTYKVLLREAMITTLILPEGEEIRGHLLGDENFFSFSSRKMEEVKGLKSALPQNVAIIEPVNPGVDTNLTIFGTSGNIYSFYLRTDSIRSPTVPHLIAYVNDPSLSSNVASALSINGTDKALAASPDNQNKASTDTTDKSLLADNPKGDYLRELPAIDPTLINRNYEIVSKLNDLAPLEIFDDGIGFTYFKFGDNFDKRDAPALYQVVDGFDVPVNMETINGHYVAKLMSDSWTLRLGKKHLCIRKIAE